MHACFQELRKRLEENHGNCAEALTKKAAADAQAAAAVSPDTPNVMQVMMLFQQTKNRAKAAQDHAKAAQDQAKVANKVALQAEKDNDVAQKEVQQLQRVMEPKRARTHAATADDDEECEKQSCDDWDLPDHRREATRIQNRRSIPLGSRGEVPTPQEGKAGPLEHSRLGRVGWIAYWSLGNSALALKIIVGLIRKLDMTDSVFEALTPIAMTREAETNAKIVMLMKAGLAETKHCRNEQQRQEFHIGLSYVMPPREGERSSTGWIRRICEQLDVQRGNRMDGRSRATNQDVDHPAQCEPPVTMLINSSELRAAGFKLKEVIPPALESQLHVVASGHEERDCEVLRAWDFKDLFCQWMMTLNSGHDVRE